MPLKFLYYLLTLICFTNCSSSKNTTSKTSSNKTENKNNLAQLNSGIDFTANGNLPTSWNISINYEDSIRFKTNDGKTLTFATNKCNRTETEIGIKLYTKIKNETLAINIFKTYCNSNKKSLNVTIEYLNETYTGCGTYIKNPALNNKWILYKLRNNFVDNYNIIPTLNIDLNKNKITGSDGCNKINATIFIEGDKIIFNEIKLTKGNCPDTEFTSLLQYQMSKNVATYILKNNMLYIYLIDDSLLIFKQTN